MGLKEFLQKRMEKSKKMKDRLAELRMEKQVQERMESPEEREIKKFLEKERHEQLSEEVKVRRSMETRNFFSTGIMDTTNIFTNHPKILTLGSNTFERGMFFK